jgi:hypothetical protein
VCVSAPHGFGCGQAGSYFLMAGWRRDGFFLWRDDWLMSINRSGQTILFSFHLQPFYFILFIP